MRKSAGAGLLLTLLLLSGAVAGEGEPERLPPAGIDEMALLLRTEGGARELERRGMGRDARCRTALLIAVHDARQSEFLNVLDNLLYLQILTPKIWGPLEHTLGADVCLTGTVRSLVKRGPHIWTMGLDVERVLLGELPPDRSGTTVRIRYEPGPVGSVMHDDVTSWSDGRRIVVFASWWADGLVAMGPCSAFPATGREDRTLSRIRPLTARDPEVVLQALRSSDEDERWLARAAVLLRCAGLSDDLGRLSRGLVALRPSDLEEIGAEIERCFAHLHDRTSWDRLRRCFVLREAAGENMAPAAAPMPPVLRSVGRSRPQGGACMSFVVDLWLPIVASAAAVFVASALMHMLLPWHRGDLRRLPGEEALLAALRAQGIAPGSYMFPGVDSMKEMSTPEMVAKYERGPVGIVTVMPSGVPAMGRSLVQWFLFIAGISFFTAYIASRSLAAGAAFGPVLAIAGAAATLAYAFAPLRDSIWKGQRWGITLKYVADGVLYGVVTGLVFALLWPCAA